MIRFAAYPGLRSPRSDRGPLRWPRRSRRGASALLAVLLLAGLLSAALMSWQASLANERVRGHARHLGEVAAAEGYALHHWLHAERIAGTVTAPGTPRVLTAGERTRLAAHSATTGWRRSSGNSQRVLLPRGWQLVHLIGQADGADLPDGIVVLRPSDEIVNRPTWEAMKQALEITVEGGSDIAETLARTALSTYDATRDRAVLASHLSRLETHAVLRQRHAGAALSPMETDLDLGGADLANVTRVSTDRATVPTLTGDCADPAGALCADHLITARLTVRTDLTQFTSATADSATFTDAVTVTGNIRTEDTRITGTLTTPELTACTDAGADLCGGGDLDIEAATGKPDWTRAAIFGDLIIRDGNRLTGITTTTADTGIFEEIEGGPVLDVDVDECFRSVRPFAHVGRC